MSVEFQRTAVESMRSVAIARRARHPMTTGSSISSSNVAENRRNVSPRTYSEATRSLQARLHIPLFICHRTVLSFPSGSMRVRNSCCCFAAPCTARRVGRRNTARCLESLPLPPTYEVKRERRKQILKKRKPGARVTYAARRVSALLLLGPCHVALIPSLLIVRSLPVSSSTFTDALAAFLAPPSVCRKRRQLQRRHPVSRSSPRRSAMTVLRGEAVAEGTPCA